MKKLRPVAIRQILNQLDKSVFTKHAFDASFNDEEKGSVVRIIYKDNPEYLFEISEIYGGWKILRSPGQLFSDPEQTNHDQFDEYEYELEQWLTRLLEEVTFDAGNSSRFIDLMRSNLEKIAEAAPYPNQPFNDIEAASWSKKLDEILAKFEEMEKRNEIQRAELIKLRDEVRQIKEVIRRVPKKTLIRSIGNRILTIADQALTRTGTEVAQEQIRRLISMIGDSE